MNHSTSFSIPSTLHGKRLDFAVSQIWKISRKKSRIWIESGRIQSKRQILSPACKVLSNESFEFFQRKSFLHIPLLQEKEDYIIINKPEPLLVHEGFGHDAEDTLAFWMENEYGPIPSLSSYEGRAGLVHRLDRLTSGIMVLGRNERGLNGIAKQFAESQVKKIYLSFHVGKPPSEGRWLSYLCRSQRDPRKRESFWYPHDSSHRWALTDFRSFSTPNGAKSLVLSRPRTGRNHQLRAQWSAAGWPIKGDPLYGNALEKSERLWLHATALSFIDPACEKRVSYLCLPCEKFLFQLEDVGLSFEKLKKEIEAFLDI